MNVSATAPAYILIDEPEMNLHPQLQLDFLTTLASYATHGVLFSTHSVGLARSAADRIYSLRKDGHRTEVTEFERTGRLSEFLGELSFSGWQELGFDSVLLVEGRTDVKTLQHLLRLYDLDHRVVLLPMGGSQMINGRAEDELRELQRITPKLFALIDSEKADAASPLQQDRLAFEGVCRNLQIRLHILERRAIENYFPEHAVRAVATDASALTPFQALHDAERPWDKNENWRIARAMQREDIADTDLGRFIQSLAETLLH